ncbi:MAG: hypothetical protein JNK02_01620 [Planctomycetes bacterium]|nr:hypothetical protein [Planctomycetota bacterium]
MLAAVPRFPPTQKPVEGGYEIDHTYTPSDVFGAFRGHWSTTTVELYFRTRDGHKRGVQKSETDWDAWELVGNAPGCAQGVVVPANGEVGVQLAGYRMHKSYRGEKVSSFYADWAGKGLSLRYAEAGSPTYPLDDTTYPLVASRTIFRNDDASTLGTYIPDGGSIGVILQSEFDTGPGLIPALPNAWELPLGLFVGFLAGLGFGAWLRRGRTRG